MTKYMTRAATHEHKACERMRALRGETVKPVGERQPAPVMLGRAAPAGEIDPSATVSFGGAVYEIDSLGYITSFEALRDIGPCDRPAPREDGKVMVRGAFDPRWRTLVEIDMEPKQ